jgi:hypothetical protein
MGANPASTATDRVAETQSDQVPQSRTWDRTQYLYAFATQHEVNSYIRTQCTEAERLRLPEILDRWVSLQPEVAELQLREFAVANNVEMVDVPVAFAETIEHYANDDRFRTSFPLASHIRMVEVDNLVAAQRTVNLEYVDRLKQRLGSTPSFESLLALCVAPQREMDHIRHLEVGQNTHVFSSKNADVRYLGSFMKEDLTPEEVGVAAGGGIPVMAVVSFIGYGSAPVNAFVFNGRCILNNGFHRAYALRSMGITHIPMVLQTCTNPALEVPPIVAGLPREYLLGAARPVLMKDFFKPDFVVGLEVRKRLRAVTLGINNIGVTDVPT